MISSFAHQLTELNRKFDEQKTSIREVHDLLLQLTIDDHPTVRNDPVNTVASSERSPARLGELCVDLARYQQQNDASSPMQWAVGGEWSTGDDISPILKVDTITLDYILIYWVRETRSTRNSL